MRYLQFKHLRAAVALVLVCVLMGTLTVPVRAEETQPTEEVVQTVEEILSQRVDAVVQSLGLTVPEEPVNLPMQANYVAGKSSSYVALGGAFVGGDSYVKMLAEELGVPYVNLTAANTQTMAQTMTTILANRETIAAADILTLGCQISPAVSLPELDLEDMAENLGNTVDWDKLMEYWGKLDALMPELPQIPELPELPELPKFPELPELPRPTDAQRLGLVLDGYVRSCGNYAAGLSWMVETVRKINPDAVLLVVGMYDPFRGVSVTADGETVQLEGMLNELVQAVNLHAASYCRTSGNAVYIDAPEVETERMSQGTAQPLSVDAFLKAVYLEGGDFLPSSQGQEYLYQRTLSGLIRVYRLAGDTRFDTAIKAADVMMSNLGLDSFDAIVVASGTGFADALSGCYLASVKNAPILLSYTTTWNQLAADYIRENLSKEGTVYILGGPAAVPEEMETMLEGVPVVRLAGENRFETNLKVLQEAGISGSEVLVCTGSGFADSLSASAVGLPILLVHDSLYEDQKTFLSGLTEPAFTVIGGEAAVPEAMAQELAAWGTVERVAGENRIATSIAIAQRYFDAPGTMVLVGAASYPDGLCGGVLANSMNAPLLLTAAGYGKTIGAYANPRGIDSGIVLGGRGSVTDAVVKFAYGLGTATNIPIQ